MVVKQKFAFEQEVFVQFSQSLIHYVKISNTIMLITFDHESSFVPFIKKFLMQMQPSFLKMINNSSITKQLHKMHAGPQSPFLPKINQSSFRMKTALSEETGLKFMHSINLRISILRGAMYNSAMLVEWSRFRAPAEQT